MNSYQKAFGLFYCFLLVFWGYLQLTHTTTSKLNFLFSFLFGLIPFFGGMIGMVKSKMWGRFGSILGKAIFFFSLGLFLWGSGENIWSYYNFFKGEPAPYPSLADIGFAPSIFFWIVGTVYLAKATGAIHAFRTSRVAKLLAIFVPVVLFAVSYHMLVRVARGGVLVPPGESPLKVVLDIAYPLGDFLALTFALVVFTLSRKYLGGFYRPAIASILVGLATMYFGDFSFSYTTTTGTFYNGNWGDLLLATGNFLMTFGILGFATKPRLRAAQPAVEGEA